jgi:hypothetical protein
MNSVVKPHPERALLVALSTVKAYDEGACEVGTIVYSSKDYLVAFGEIYKDVQSVAG